MSTADSSFHVTYQRVIGRSSFNVTKSFKETLCNLVFHWSYSNHFTYILVSHFVLVPQYQAMIGPATSPGGISTNDCIGCINGNIISLEGKIALITGGASGIGEIIVRLFLSHGAKVCIADVQDEAGHNLCKSLGGEQLASFLHCDVTIEDDVQNAVDFTAERYGTIDIMVNNAGVSGSRVTDIQNATLDEFKSVFDVNVNGVFLGMKHAARLMIPKGKGSIISLASVSSVLGGFGPHSYTGSKHAVLGLTKSVASELGKHGIRVNCVSPYAVPTKLSLSHLPVEERTEDAIKSFLSFVGNHANLKGVDAMPEDVAYAVLYLASDESKYVSGLNLTVDGGVTCVNTSLRSFG